MTSGLSKDIRCHVWPYFVKLATQATPKSGLSVWWCHMVTLIFLRGLCGYVWVNILTLSPPRGGHTRVGVPELLNPKTSNHVTCAALALKALVLEGHPSLNGASLTSKKVSTDDDKVFHGRKLVDTICCHHMRHVLHSWSDLHNCFFKDYMGLIMSLVYFVDLAHMHFRLMLQMETNTFLHRKCDGSKFVHKQSKRYEFSSNWHC